MNYGIDKLTAIPVIVTKQTGNNTYSTNVDNNIPLDVDTVMRPTRYSYTGTVNANASVTHDVSNVIDAERVLVCLQYACQNASKTINGRLSINRIINNASGNPLAPTPDTDEEYSFTTTSTSAVSMVVNVTRMADTLSIKIRNLDTSNDVLVYALTVVVLK